MTVAMNVERMPRPDHKAKPFSRPRPRKKWAKKRAAMKGAWR